jgi:hypothetical protein
VAKIALIPGQRLPIREDSFEGMDRLIVKSARDRRGRADLAFPEAIKRRDGSSVARRSGRSGRDGFDERRGELLDVLAARRVRG